MVKRHTPRPPSRRRLPPILPVGTAAPAAMPDSRVPDPHETATSAPALLSGDVVPDADVGPSVAGESEHDEALAPAADAGPAEPAQDLDIMSPALAALQPPPTLEDFPLVVATPAPGTRPFIAPPFMPTDLTAAGATLQAFLLNEGLAAFAHWQALAKVRSPAEVLRLQVDEMQRAAEASLTCMGRIAGHLGRIGAP